jgi:hypothetical protein
VKKTLFCLLLLCGLARADATPSSPYDLYWSFPDDAVSAIDVDIGDLSKSRFKTDYELVKYLGALKKEKPVKPKPGETAAPSRELRVDQRDPDGKVRSTTRYVAPLQTWRNRLGEDMVERLEDEFDAHLRMVLPRRNVPVHPPGPSSPPPTDKHGSRNRQQATGNRQQAMSDPGSHGVLVRSAFPASGGALLPAASTARPLRNCLLPVACCLLPVSDEPVA